MIARKEESIEPNPKVTAVAVVDLIEFQYHVNKTKTMDERQWMRWKELAKALMTIPKFRRV